MQDDFTGENVAAEVRKILVDGPERFSMLDALAGVQACLRSKGQGSAAERAVDVIRKLLPARATI